MSASVSWRRRRPGAFPTRGVPAVARGRRAAAVAFAWGTLAAVPAAAPAQEGEPLPVIPAGVPVVVLPVQSAHPVPDGSWPGGARSLQETLEAFGAELAFAFGEERGAEGWVMPAAVADRARRNPVVGVDPGRLAYHGLLRKPDRREQLYEPLHGQLRRLAALFGARIVVLPLALWYEPLPDASGATADARPGAEAAPGRPVLLLALVDIRRSAVLWHGRIEGEPAPSGEAALLANLAHRVARQLAPS